MLFKHRVTITSSAAGPNSFPLTSTQIVYNFDLLGRGQLLQQSLHLNLDAAIRYQPAVRQRQVGHRRCVMLGKPVCDCITLVSVVICCCHRVFKVILHVKLKLWQTAHLMTADTLCVPAASAAMHTWLDHNPTEGQCSCSRAQAKQQAK